MNRKMVLLWVVALAITACSSSPRGISLPDSSSSRPSTASGSHRGSAAPSSAVPAAAQSSLLAGSARPQYPAGTPGRISVVYHAPIRPQADGTTVPLVFRNNTNAAIAHVDITATTKDPTGKIIGSGISQGTYPSTVQPGQWALSFVYYQPSTALAANDSLSFSFQTSPATTGFYNTAAVQVTQSNRSGTSIAGGVQNTTGRPVQGPVSIGVFCLNSAGDPVNEIGGFTSGGSGNLAVGATDSFQVDLIQTPCPSYLVGASGYYG